MSTFTNEERPPARAAGAGGGLPCQYSNNSTDRLTGGHKRTAFALTENVTLLAQKFGIERLGFLTLTFADHVTEIEEAQRRFNSLRTHVLAKRYAASIAVVERMRSGRIHFHLLVVLADDIRTGFDFNAVRVGDYKSANLALRAEWAFWRRDAKKYGFGRTELMPVKSNTEAISRYVGKYIQKHIGKRDDRDKGARLVRYTADARQVGTRFAWVGVKPALFRAKLKVAAEELGCPTMQALRCRFGPRWAWMLAGYIMSTRLRRDQYPSVEHMLADRADMLENGYDEEWLAEMFGGAGGESPPERGARRSADSPEPHLEPSCPIKADRD